MGGPGEASREIGVGHGRSQTTQNEVQGAHAPGPLEGRRADVRGLPALPGTEVAAQGLPELRLLRRPSGSGNGVTTSALEVLGAPPEGGPLYDLALTHRSFAFEQGDEAVHNERLEFLGDAILEAVVTHLIYTDFPDISEGEMARLRASVVNTRSLAALAREIELGPSLRLGRGEEASGGRDKASLLADTFEAIVGAVYLDRGYDAVRGALARLFRGRLAASHAGKERYDAKTALQEVVVRDTGGTPVYRVASTGPDHDKRFTAEVHVDGRLMGAGAGRSKKEAEYNAAREALARIDERPHTSGDEEARGARAS